MNNELVRLVFVNNDGMQVVFGFPQGFHFEPELHKHYVLLKHPTKEFNHKIWMKDILRWEQWNEY